MEIKRLIVGMVQTNCYIAVHPETKEAVIVDPGDEAARIEDALAQTGAKAKAILLTHGHFDHVTAMEELRRDLGVPVYACEQEQAVLADPDKNLSVQFQGGGLHLMERRSRQRATRSRCFIHRDIQKVPVVIM